LAESGIAALISLTVQARFFYLGTANTSIDRSVTGLDREQIATHPIRSDVELRHALDFF
jgi:hypothetical protein